MIEAKQHGNKAHGSANLLPLVVDLDGTLTPTDTLIECVLGLLKRAPFQLFALTFMLLSGRANFKQYVATRYRFSAINLPLREDFLDWLRGQRMQGRRLILATAAHEDIAKDVAVRLGIFDTVLATDLRQNLKGSAKLAAIREVVGSRFVYAGDSSADLPIWQAAEAAVLVNTSRSVTRAVNSSLVSIEKEFVYSPTSARTWLRALRVHQWVKNLLLFVPLFTAFAFGDSDKAIAALLAFLAFSLAASATYLMNDMWDLESDRLHARKKMRPFASAMIPLSHGALMVSVLSLAAVGLALVVSKAFLFMLVGYVVLTTAYSLQLKQYVLIDVLTLALLYTFRVLAGSVATAIAVTPWLLAFSVFTFFSLALVKRCSELVSLQVTGNRSAHGRDYQVGDLVVLWPLGVGASLCSVVVFGLYIGSPSAIALYGDSDALWLVGVGLIYWIGRLWVKTARGEMHDDPIVFAVRDFGSRVTIIAMLATTVLAHYIG